MPDDILERIRQRIDPPDAAHLGILRPEQRQRPPRSDYDLNGHLPANRPDPAVLKPAAVLVPLITGPEPGALTILLTHRASHLSRHAGQVAFPGGRLDPDDPGPVEAALREAQEEVGLSPDRVRVLGVLDPYETVTGFYVLPVVGLIEGPFAPVIDPSEVASAFEVPAAFLLDPANQQRHTRAFQGAERHFYAIPYGDHYIWGATAHMLVAFTRRLLEP